MSYVNRQAGTYDGEGVLKAAGSISANFAAGTKVNVGENVELNVVAQVRGTATGTSPTLDVVIQESDTEGGAYTDVAGGSFSQITASGEQKILLRTTKAWITAKGTVGGTTPVFPDAEVFIAV